jgi:hypothetical protein
MAVQEEFQGIVSAVLSVISPQRTVENRFNLPDDLS